MAEQSLKGEWGIVYDTGRFKYAETEMADASYEPAICFMMEVSMCHYAVTMASQHILIYIASHTVIYNLDLFK